jgi:trehalose 6-phosphate synthase/phosphatase
MFAKKIDKELILAAYRKSERRIFFLDYDGTLVPFMDRPQDSNLDPEIRSIITRLINEPRNRIYIISGRDKLFLEQQFHDIRVGLIAEHGFLIKETGENWAPQNNINNGWTKEVKEILQRFTEQVRGSFIEEKESSVAYHFRTAEYPTENKTLPLLRKELKKFQQDHPGLEVMSGHKVVELKPAGYNKGITAARILSGMNWDFILAAGDDFSDEQLFVKMPGEAFTIKIGTSKTSARYFISSRDNFTEFLSEICEIA